MGYISLELGRFVLKWIRIRLIVSFSPLFIFIVRVGGGYLSIDEFIDTFTPLELERLDRNDPMKKFSERVAV